MRILNIGLQRDEAALKLTPFKEKPAGGNVVRF